ncbi:MAG: hypothetical protein DRP57_09810 [Spirochaetes bacterium]|nr:MAG: hypothetical protein DRP57_09810 [Spirochaetota bacterium]
MFSLKKRRGNVDSEYQGYLKKAGYSKLTLLQSRVIPLILKGGDIAVEAGEREGKTAAFILPVIKKLKTGNPGIKAVVLTSENTKVRKIAREFNKFLRQGPKLSFFVLNEDNEIRREVNQLLKPHDIIIGTPKRIIDHIRRGNLNFTGVEIALIYAPWNSRESFTADVEFIVSKFPHTKQLVLYTRNLKEEGGLLALLTHPEVIPMSAWKKTGSNSLHFYIETADKDKFETVTNIILSKNLEKLVIYCNTSSAAAKVNQLLKRKGFGAEIMLNTFPYTKKVQIIQNFNREVFPIITAEKSAFNNFKVNARYIINYSVPADETDYMERLKIGSTEMTDPVSVTTLTTTEETEILLKIQEKTEMDIKKAKTPDTEDIIQGTIKRIIQKIKEEENRDVLNSYKKLIKKNTPFTLRSYFTAYLFKEYFEQTGPKHARTEHAPVTKLFVSVGKNRRVFQKDLAGLFMKNLNIKRSAISSIRILDNYSFIDVPSKIADEAIKKLNGLDFHGRKITVNYARKKEDKKE